MKKLLLILVLAITLALSGCDGNLDYSQDRCGENGEWVSTTMSPSNEGYCKYDGYYTQEEVDEEIGQEIHDFEVSRGLDVILESCDNADTPYDIGGLGDTDCEELVTWYADNWEELYDLLEYMTNDDLFASELDNYLIEQYQIQIDELEDEILHLYELVHALYEKLEEEYVKQEQYQSEIQQLEQRIIELESEATE